MFERTIRFGALPVLWAVMFLVGLGMGGVRAETKTPEFTNQRFVDAAHNNCTMVQGRPPRSCECERKLISGDRLSDEDKEMAYYFWVDKKEYAKRFEAKKKANPEWQSGFAQRFNDLQALIITACGR